MSRHPSPGPSSQPSHQPSSVSARQKPPKPYAIGIAAGAEDVKYQTKYKELKRKVKDIEADNDKLHFKVLQAKRSIQRMKVERAILYERLSSTTPPPDVHDRHAMQQIHHPVPAHPPYQQPLRGYPGNVQHREIRDHVPPGDDHAHAEYLRTQGNPRPAPTSDARHLPTMEYPIGPNVTSPHMVHSPRRSSSGHESARQLPHMQSLPSMPIEIPRTHSLPPPHTSPSLHHSHVPSSNERSRSHHSSHSRGHPSSQAYAPGPNQPPYPDNRTPTHHTQSPALPERERSRRHDIHEANEPHNLARHQTPVAQPSPSLHPADVRSSTRAHGHQPVAPGTYISRDEQHDMQDIERDRDWERSRELNRSREYPSSHLSSPLLHRSRSVLERGEHSDHHLSRSREDSGYYHEGNYPMHRRPDSPGPGSGLRDSQRPDTLGQSYDTERSRSYRLRPVNQPHDDHEYMHTEDARSQTGGAPPPMEPSQSRAPVELSRKRSRNEMDVDSDSEAEMAPGATNAGYMGGRLSDDRSTKRYHLPRNIDNHEDSRMGPP
ncbi:hypothetical protein APHAL10511_001684 [Amanita phalloides]|nr:hypothetical protein APHAL10511_001684 [Amanita phalloides]